ncbi:MAG: hypothetical protein LUD15_15185 [Bacteroides sp.]|nr:hypothetical protein [Bacteroides sp.]
MILKLLNDYSVSQVYNIIYRSINSVLRFRAEKEFTEVYTSNMVIGGMQRFGEKARKEGWELQKYTRLKECPQSALSKFFFEKILPIGDREFNEVSRLPEA